MVGLVQFGLFILAAGLVSWLVIRRQLAVAKRKRKYLAGLLLMGGSAFNNRNPVLYAAAMGEIANIMRSERWEHNEIKSRIHRALSTAEDSCSPDVFETANRLAKNLMSIAAHGRGGAA